MKYLITGCAGYIGSRLVNTLLDQGHEVYGVDDLRYGGSHFSTIVMNNNFNFIKTDVRDLNAYRHFFNECDVYIPLAALVGAPLCEKKQDDAWAINYQIIEETIKLLPDSVRIIYPNTNSGYGITDGISEVDEDSPLQPISVYGKS